MDFQKYQSEGDPMRLVPTAPAPIPRTADGCGRARNLKFCDISIVGHLLI